MSVTYYTATGQNAFNAVTTIGLPVWETPIPGYDAPIVFRQRFMQTAASFSNATLDTPYSAAGSYGVPATPTFYLVSEENFSDVRAGLIEWDRVFAAVPDSWSEPEEYANTYVGYFSSGPGTGFSVTSITVSGAQTVMSSTINTVTVGDSIFISLTYSRSGISYGIAQSATVVSFSSGASVSISNILPGEGDFLNESGTVRAASQGRASARTQIVGSRVVYDYALSTVASLNENLPILQKFSPMNSLGASIDYLQSSLCFPTSGEYLAMIANGTEIIAESSSRRRWLGNIYVRQTRLVPAL